MAKSKTQTSTKSKSGTTVNNTSTTKEVRTTANANLNDHLESAIDGSMRLFGLPHQFTSINDPRIGEKSDLGRCFAEKIMMEAPIICLKPGIPDFLPGKKTDEKAAFTSAIIDAVNSNTSLNEIFGSVDFNEESRDSLVYYSIKDDYSGMMAKVNLMCKMMAVFLGIADDPVPWAKNAKYGNYDWRYYAMKNVYNDLTFSPKTSKGSVGAFIENSLNVAEETLMTDTQWLRFYVDSNASFTESASNSTTSSILESFTEKLESVAKELDTIAGIAGTNSLENAAEKAKTNVNQYIDQQLQQNDSGFGNILKRIVGNTTQIISGGNFLLPEIWSDSDYNKSYSFSITLSTPYGNTESWYLNIGVPLCHILGLCLPQQLTANTYKSPYLVKCYSKGWFNCNYGIIDSVSIDKGADNSWSVGGLPNEIKVSLSVKDLYNTLSLPVEPYVDSSTFLSTGMLEFLMVNCGIDITSQDMSDRFNVWKTILGNNFTDRFTSIPYNIQNYFKSKIQGIFNVIK